MRAMSISLRRLFVRTAAAAFAERAQSAAILAASILFVTLDGPAQAQVTGTTTQLTTNPAPQLDPAITGDIVVYTDQRNGNDDVHYVRISDLAEVRVTNDSTAQRLNDIDDNRVVFTSNASGNNDIWLYEFTIASTGYEFSGFTAPVDAWPVTNSMKAGAAVPMKFSLGGDRGLEIFESGSPSSQPLSCDANAPTDPVEQTVSAGGSSLAYDAATDTDDVIGSFTSGTILLEVHGIPVTASDVRSEADFTFAVDANAVFGTKPGIYRATIARGYWGLVGPLSTGAHTVHILASGPHFGLDVTYQLEVIASTN